jgi:uncharacterized protein
VDRVRSAEVAAVAASVVRWALARPDVRAVGMAGSEARGEARPDSDLDLVVVVDDPESLRAGEEAAAALPGGAVEVRTREWGPVLERRFRLPNGLEVELGLAPASWAAVPVDVGTARVVADGFRVLSDPEGLLTRLVRAVAQES